jgi:hypothetical protein
MSDTRARVPEPEFPPGPAAPTACTVPGAMVFHRQLRLSGTLWRTAGRPGRGLSSRDPLRGRYRSGAQPDLVVNCSPQSSVALCSAPGRAMSTRHGRLVPPFQRSSLVPRAAQDFCGFPERSPMGRCGTCHRGSQTAEDLTFRGHPWNRISIRPGPAALPPAAGCAPPKGSGLHERAPQEPRPARRHPLQSSGCTLDIRYSCPCPRACVPSRPSSTNGLHGAWRDGVPRPPASLGLAPSPAPRPGGGSQPLSVRRGYSGGEGCPRGTHCVGATAGNPTEAVPRARGDATAPLDARGTGDPRPR